MKYRLLSILFWIFVLSACTNEPEITNDNEPEITYDNAVFYIDSIYNITSNSATVKATLTIQKYGTVPVSGLYLEIGRKIDPVDDSLYRELNFDKKVGTVKLIITDLKPNTLYYIQPMARFNPNIGRITGMGSPSSEESFTTLAN